MKRSLVPTIAITQTEVNARFELNLIGANTRGLKGPGRELMPLKPDMLSSPEPELSMVLEAVELMFEASMRYVGAQIAERVAEDAVSVVAARIAKGMADGTCTALLHGPTADLLAKACEQAPIAMHAILLICPELDLKTRLTEVISLRRIR